MDIVFENVTEGKATLIFSTYFHTIRSKYSHVVQFIKSYFASTEFNKRLKLMRAGGISNNAPQFNFTLQRVAHDEFPVWASIMKRKLHLHLQTSVGCLAPYLVNGQKLGKKWQTKENEDEQTPIQPFRYRF
ncbi:MAG: hypothetical protein K2H44_05210 [Muribaculaceae bacterium]|nr:hypothetical protein [Muribaculaceae bacterium]